MLASEILREARNVLFERGWSPRTWEAKDGSVCIRGALNLAAGRTAHDYTQPSVEAGYVILDSLGWTHDTSVARFNDAPERTFDEVVELLDRAEKFALIAEESDA